MPRSRARFVFLLAIGLTAANATPVTYDIVFERTYGLGPVPTGRFTFDASPSPVFSEFQVTWGAVTFDMTTAANGPFVFGPCQGTGGAGITFALLGAPLPCAFPNTYRQWGGFFWNSSYPVFGFADEYVFGPDATGGVQVNAQIPAPWPFQEHAGGSFRIEVATFDVPEPATMSMILAGTVILGCLGRRRRKVLTGRTGENRAERGKLAPGAIAADGSVTL